MKTIALLALLFTCAVFAQRPEYRLIQTSENDPGTWMTEEQIDRLAVSDVGFMDITNNVEPRFLASTPPPIPNQPQQKNVVRSLIDTLVVSNMKAYDEVLTSYFTRSYKSTTGVQAAEWIYSTLVALSSDRDDISVSFFNNTFPQPSVIARFEANTNPDEIVILGSHEDTTNLLSVNPAPGADDDGSGSSTNLEVFRNLVDSGFKPNRTLEFHFYAAEEAGLLGSQAVASQYDAEAKNVVGMMQLDMTYYQSKDNVIGIVTDYTNATLTHFVRQLVGAYCDIPYMDTKCGYGCSDHASWTKYGYRSVFPFETPFDDHNPYIHTKDDTVEHVTWEHGMQFAKLATGFVVELSATDYTPLGN